MTRTFYLPLSALVICALGTLIFETPTAAQRPMSKYRPHRGTRVPNQYMVVLNDDVVGGAASTEASVGAVADELSANHGGQRRHLYTRALNGFAVRMPEAAARRLSEDPRVAYVEEDGVVSASAVQAAPPNWGLDRIDQRSSILDNHYTYLGDGTGVHIYVVDTGVYTGHSAFGGRAFSAYDAVGDGQPLDSDCNGHGTNVAGIAASGPYGVAKNATVYSVRVLGCSSTGTWIDVVEGLDWIVANHVKPAVINMSIGGGLSLFANEAIDRATQAGVVFVGSAGNQGQDACGFTPGAAAAGITVGNVGTDSVRAVNSNYGPCVDIFAPGEGIASAAPGSPTASLAYWGTSQAAPHVAGAAALYLQRHPSASVAEVTETILSGATKDAVIDAINGPNRLLYALHLGDGAPPSVGLTAPLQSSTIRGAVTVSANATDESEVAAVRFTVDNVTIGTDTSRPYAVTWTTTSVANGTHTVRAVATDLAGNSTENGVIVTVANSSDTTLPSVTITSPIHGATVSGLVTLAATASDNVAVSRVEFHRNGTLLGTDASAPYTLDWNTSGLQDGDYSVTARAVDTSNNAAWSFPIVVWVSNTTGNLPAGWSAGDIGSVDLAGAAGYDGTNFTLQAAGHDLYSTSDSFHYAYRSWTGDGEIVTRVSGLSKPSDAAFALAGVTFREATTSNVRHASLLVATDGKVKFRRRTAVGGTTLSDGPSAASVTLPLWLKVKRLGNVFTAWRSADGLNWTQTGPAATIELPKTVSVGVWALRNAGTSRTTAQFTHVALNVPSTLPAGWTSHDVGTVGTPGTATYSDGVYTVRGGGADIWSTADAFHFVHRTWSGDGDLIARLGSLSSPAGASWAMGGIMIRDGLAANAAHAALLVGTDGKLKFRRRTAAGGTTLSNGPTVGTTTVPQWLKLSRRGTQVSAYTSADGATWTPVYVAQSITLPSTVEIGLWTLRSGGGALAESSFSQITITTPLAGSSTEGS